MPPRKSAKTKPQILEMAAQKMAVVRAKGAPDKVIKTIIRYPLKKAH